MSVYIGSGKKPETVEWNENNPGFYVKAARSQELESVKNILQMEHIFFAGSFMGCSCGLYYNTYSESEPEEDRPLRVRDLVALKKYLQENLPGNELKLFVTWWDGILEDYPAEDFSLDKIKPDDYLLEQDIVYTLKP